MGEPKERVGEGVFRNGLVDFREGLSPRSRLAVVESRRASHMKSRVDCETDAERIVVFDGLLLNPHLDAAFDRGFISLEDGSRVVLADSLDAPARAALRLNGSLQPANLTDAHRAHVTWHQERVFRGPGGAV